MVRDLLPVRQTHLGSHQSFNQRYGIGVGQTDSSPSDLQATILNRLDLLVVTKRLIQTFNRKKRLQQSGVQKAILKLIVLKLRFIALQFLHEFCGLYGQFLSRELTQQCRLKQNENRKKQRRQCSAGSPAGVITEFWCKKIGAHRMHMGKRLDRTIA